MEQQIQAALERVRVILDATKDPQAAGEVHHQTLGMPQAWNVSPNAANPSNKTSMIT